MSLRRLWAVAILLLALGALAATAGQAAGQQTGTKGAKPRTFDDESLKKYRDKGNITTSAQPQAAKPQGKDAAADEGELFASGLGTEGQGIRNAYYSARKDAQTSSDELNRLSVRWAELHKQLSRTKSPRERARIRKELESVQAAMSAASQKGQQSDERMQNAMAQADKNGILKPPSPKVKVETAAKAPVDPGR